MVDQRGAVSRKNLLKNGELHTQREEEPTVSERQDWASLPFTNGGRQRSMRLILQKWDKGRKYMKTIKQIADELGVSKQKVYRFIVRNHITASSEVKQSKLYDEATEMLIKQGILEDEPYQKSHHEAHQNHINDTVSEAVIELLRKEMEQKNEQLQEKDRQIREKDQQISEMQAQLSMNQKLMDQEQQLRKCQHLV